MPSAGIETKLWVWQRASAAVLGLCVIVHLILIIIAVQGGLSAGEIISRVSGNVAWLMFYSVFVIAVAVHAPIGVRTILNEMTRLKTSQTYLVMAVLCLVILSMGFRTVIGLYNAGGV
ncbi:succinate dehydrogenase [Rhodospirillales bacterium]|jgi:fumarate reductase subunit C|nr:succinate dehydrogenase [Rhodospirillales bacterium]